MACMTYFCHECGWQHFDNLDWWTCPDCGGRLQRTFDERSEGYED